MDSVRSKSPDRAAERRRAIVVAATEVFITHGYVGATTDEIAARAAVSKQSVYKLFGDKQNLFAEAIRETNAGLLDELVARVDMAFGDAADARTALRRMADGWLRGMLDPAVLKLRRLVIAEADRFPDVGRAWFDFGFDRALVLLGQALQGLAGNGLLRPLDDPRRAAYHLAGLVMYQPLNQAMFAGTDSVPSAGELDQIAETAVEVFLAAYGPEPCAHPS